MSTIFEGLCALFRWRPVLAWGISGVVLGVGTAIYDVGIGIHWFYVLISLIMVLIIQGWLAHSLNDLADEEVDRDAPIEKTGRVKVLITGIMMRSDLVMVSVISLLAVIAIILFLTVELGWMVLLFAAVGLYAPIAYSLPPLKLGYRPFSEFTIVFPTLVALVTGVNFVSTGVVSSTAVTMGVIFALSNMVWFMISRAQDVDADRAHGKNTTIVRYGYNVGGVVMVLCACGMAGVGAVTCETNVMLVVIVMFLSYCIILYNLDMDNPESCGATRKKAMMVVSLIMILSGIGFALLGVVIHGI